MPHDNISTPAVQPPGVDSVSVHHLPADSAAQPAGVEADSPADSSFTVYVRGKDCPTKTASQFTAATPVEAFRAAFEWADCTVPEPVIYWHGTDKLAAVDMDVHDKRPDDCTFNAFLLDYPSVRPCFSWRTHGGGYRLIYTAADGFAADELAAVVVYEMRSALPAWFRRLGVRPTFEVKSQTRHPRYKRGDQTTSDVCDRGVRPGDGYAVRPAVAKLLSRPGEVSDEVIEDYIDEQELQIGQRMPHDECPIDPLHTSRSPNPVVLLGRGYYCHSCAGQGKTYRGCKKPGFVPYGMLVDRSQIEYGRNIVREAVRGFVHWEQAVYYFRHVLRRQMNDKEAEDLYKLLLKVWHLSDVEEGDPRRPVIEARINEVFIRSACVRQREYLAKADDLLTAIRKDTVPGFVRSLPATKYVEVVEKREKVVARAVPDQRKIAQFASNVDLVKLGFGYYPLRVVRGIDLLGTVGDPHADDTTDEIPALVPCTPAFEYRRPEERRPLIRDLSGYFPGVNLNYVKLLIAAKAFVQRGIAESPLILVTGQTGSGKSATVHLAAELSGDRVRDISTVVKNADRYYTAYGEAAVKSGYVLCDEIAKKSLSVNELQERFLGMTRQREFWRLHSGTAELPALPVTVLCDTLIPDGFQTDPQLGRRTLYAPLGSGAGSQDWTLTCGGLIQGWRARAEYHTAIADAIVSEVMDELKGENGHQRCHTLTEYAERLGFGTMLKHAADMDTNAPFVNLFVAAMNAPQTTQPRWKAKPGWRATLPEADTPLAAAWRDAMGATPNKQLLTGRQWGTLIGISDLECDVDNHGQWWAIRFRVGEPNAATKIVGESLVDLLPTDSPVRRLIGEQLPAEPAVRTGLGQSGQGPDRVAPVVAT